MIYYSTINLLYVSIFLQHVGLQSILPRCMQCRRGLATRTVRLSNAWIVTKRKNNLSRFFIPYTKHHLALFSEKKNGCWEATSSTWNFGLSRLRWSEITDFQWIFVRSTIAVTPSKKSSHRVAQKRKVSKIWTITCDNTETVLDRMSVTTKD